jgi:hypothetical protein
MTLMLSIDSHKLTMMMWLRLLSSCMCHSDLHTAHTKIGRRSLKQGTPGHCTHIRYHQCMPYLLLI